MLSKKVLVALLLVLFLLLGCLNSTNQITDNNLIPKSSSSLPNSSLLGASAQIMAEEVRAEATQSVEESLSNRFSSHFNSLSDRDLVDLVRNETTFDSFKQNIVVSEFSPDGLSVSVTDTFTNFLLGSDRSLNNLNLANHFQSDYSLATHRACLNSCDPVVRKQSTAATQEKLRLALKTLITEEVKSGKLIQNLNCPNLGGSCSSSSFDVVIDFGLKNADGSYLLSDNYFVGLPSIEVQSRSGSDSFSVPIVSRQTVIKSHVESNFFKHAWDLMRP